MGSISAAQQFKAVAELRWRLFRNTFRRKGGAGEMWARIVALPFVGVILFGAMTGAATSSYFAVASGHFEVLAAIYWGIFVLQMIVSVNISQPGLSFDPESLIRFPLSFPRYLLIRLFLGLLSVSTIVGTAALLAGAAGAALGTRSGELAAKMTVPTGPLTVVLFAVALALAVTNMLFTRMVFAWVDRWLSTRRAREAFTFLIIAFSIGIQYVNVTVNNFGHKYTHAQQMAKLRAARQAYHAVEPVLHVLPPGLGGLAVVRTLAGQTGAAAGLVTGVLLFGLVFLAVFAWRMQREYRGENLSEVQGGRTSAVVRADSPVAAATAERLPSGAGGPFAANLHKEWIYVRRNLAQFYGLLAPLAMVFLFASRMGRFGSTGMIFPAAAAYSILGVAALAYNILGLDGNGVQFYFLSPVPLRTIFLSKNIFGFGITAVQLVLLYVLVAVTAGRPPVLTTLSTVCWVVFAALVNVTVGNIRSITTPKKIDPSKLSRKQASQMSALISLGLMLGVGALGAGLVVVSRLLRMEWLPIPILLMLSVGAGALYWAGLDKVDGLALAHRETLVEELSKTE